MASLDIVCSRSFTRPRRRGHAAMRTHVASTTPGRFQRSRPPHNYVFPRSPKLDEGRSPAASPADPPEEEPPPPRLETRRKSSSWKTFNLKRQLSRVDLKFKAAFAAAPEPPEPEPEPEPGEPGEAGDDAAEERAEPEAAQEAGESPDSDESKPSSEERSRGASPLRGTDVFERMHRELQERGADDVYARMHRELHERWAARPDSLPLAPAPPPRRRREPDRLLSVPNIKYRAADARRAAPASFAGSLMRRFSEYPPRSPHASSPRRVSR